MKRSLQRLLRAWWRGSDGVSAVEFALFAPILFFGFLAMVDVGFALYERMSIDSVLRAGVRTAMADAGETPVRDVIVSTAGNNGFSVSSEPCGPQDTERLGLCVGRVFACPAQPEETFATLPSCTGGAAPYIYYALSAGKRYEGIFLPIKVGSYELADLMVGSTARVQVR
ncbi:MAG TPA: TadE/TadG family type IV pilus assembly protein [Afifellaceae bacterium]|nr:TadE/TadG family type IV pilus assembly protein [Afifellaceae bacterium]